MAKIGNIVTESPNNPQYYLFNVVDDLSLIDDSLPTLVIGLDNAKKYIKNFSILKKIYDNNMLQWTFTRRERRKEYNDDLNSFKEYCILKDVKNIKYSYIDIINYPLSRIKKMIKYINSYDVKYCFITKNSNFIFIYSKKYNTVWGLSLTLCEYIGIAKKKVIEKIRINPYNNIIKDITVISEDIRKKVGNNTHYLLPIYHYFS